MKNIDLINMERILIVCPYNREDVLEANSGGPRLVREEIQYLEKNNICVDLLPLPEVSLGFYFFDEIFNQKAKEKQKVYKKAIQKGEYFPVGNLLLPFNRVLLEFVIRIFDLTYHRKLEEIRKIPYDLVLYNLPFGAKYFKEKTKLKTVVVEHNVEFNFLEAKFRYMGMKNSSFENFLLKLHRFIEIINIESADLIITLNTKDKDRISRVLKDDGKVKTWVPLLIKQEKIPLILNKNKIKIGYIGSHCPHNVDAVKKIISVADKCNKEKFEFSIIGNVKDAFSKDSVPKNVKFLGFVESIDKALEECDLFINPKSISETGIEIKTFDYLKYKKPIISTEMGALGFENFIGSRIFIANTINEMCNILYSLSHFKEELNEGK